MKRKLSIVLLLCVLSLMMSGCASHQITRQGKKVESQEEKIESLIKQLAKNPNSDIRIDAASALGRISGPAKDTVPVLAKALYDKNKSVRLTAATALRKIATPEAVKAVKE